MGLHQTSHHLSLKVGKVIAISAGGTKDAGNWRVRDSTGTVPLTSATHVFSEGVVHKAQIAYCPGAAT